jgi:hypothetical protein
MTYALPAWKLAADIHLFEIAALAKQDSPHQWYIFKLHTGPRVTHGFPSTVYL